VSGSDGENDRSLLVNLIEDPDIVGTQTEESVGRGDPLDVLRRRLRSEAS
jgi:hypothetical protein